MAALSATIGPIAKHVAATLARIADLNPTLNAYIEVFEADAMEQAHALDEELRQGRSRGPLHGRTISLKDLIDVRGVPTTAASRSRAGHVAAEDATLVTRLREAGAVLVGKTNLHELALGTTSDESAFGPVRNPLDPHRSPGGSSGGSAAAVASGMGWASIGSDTGGSIRIPASACGVVGLKPTFGEIPMAGVMPLSVSLDHVGPIAQDVRAAWAIYAALMSAAPPKAEPGSVGTARLGRLDGYFLAKLDDAVRARFEDAMRRAHDAGATIIDVDLGSVPDIATTYLNVALVEAYAYHADALKTMPDRFSDSVRTRLEMGRTISRDNYVQSQSDRATLRAAVDTALANCDALVLPTLPIPPQPVGATTAVLGSTEEPLRPLTLRLTQLFNLTGHPAISIPCGNTLDGLPCGLQLVGRRQKTSDLLQVALNFEAIVSPRVPSSSPPR
jgi:aspartyl-tRNA(Asn)/glutamyl-tRNA(Gln) amidotransferase subunit A